MLSNTTITLLDDLSVQDISKLPPVDLHILNQQVDELSALAAKRKRRLQDALALRYTDAAAQMRRDAGKDTGVVHVMDAGFDVTCNLDKRVKWDQAVMWDVAQRIPLAEWRQYMKVTLEVSETAYKAWPDQIREVFNPARTVETAAPKFTLSPQGEREAA